MIFSSSRNAQRTSIARERTRQRHSNDLRHTSRQPPKRVCHAVCLLLRTEAAARLARRPSAAGANAVLRPLATIPPEAACALKSRTTVAAIEAAMPRTSALRCASDG